MVMCSNLFQYIVSHWLIFVMCFATIQNMCSPLFTFILTLLTKALRSIRQKPFLADLGSCYTTLDANLFEDAAALLLGYIGTYLHLK